MDIATAHARLGSAASTVLAGKHQLLIDGKWVDAKSAKTFDVFDPANGQAIAAVALKLFHPGSDVERSNGGE